MASLSNSRIVLDAIHRAVLEFICWISFATFMAALFRFGFRFPMFLRAQLTAFLNTRSTRLVEKFICNECGSEKNVVRIRCAKCDKNFLWGSKLNIYKIEPVHFFSSSLFKARSLYESLIKSLSWILSFFIKSSKLFLSFTESVVSLSNSINIPRSST